MSKKYIFDLDNTLVFTDDLNTEAYNFALKKVGLACIADVPRITRKTIMQEFPSLRIRCVKKIFKIRQNYFCKNLEKTKLNEAVFKELISKNPRDCFLWLSADQTRANAILKHYKLKKYFDKIIFSPKRDIGEDLKKITRFARCSVSDLVFYEDDKVIFEKLRACHCKINYIMK